MLISVNQESRELQPSCALPRPISSDPFIVATPPTSEVPPLTKQCLTLRKGVQTHAHGGHFRPRVTASNHEKCSEGRSGCSDTLQHTWDSGLPSLHPQRVLHWVLRWVHSNEPLSSLEPRPAATFTPRCPCLTAACCCFFCVESMWFPLTEEPTAE